MTPGRNLGIKLGAKINRGGEDSARSASLAGAARGRTVGMEWFQHTGSFMLIVAAVAHFASVECEYVTVLAFTAGTLFAIPLVVDAWGDFTGRGRM